jgi:hypothetical protein
LTVGSVVGVGILKTELVDEEAATADDEESVTADDEDSACLFTLTTSPTTTVATHNKKMETKSLILTYR